VIRNDENLYEAVIDEIGEKVDRTGRYGYKVRVLSPLTAMESHADH
jgi:hypothetical protein